MNVLMIKPPVTQINTLEVISFFNTMSDNMLMQLQE